MAVSTLEKNVVGAFRQRLLDKKQELVRAIAQTELEGRQTEDCDTRDMADQANNCYTKETLFQQSSAERGLLLLVQAALRRADHGEFGFCIECGEPVHKKRLEAVPWAGLCVTCQKLREKGLL